MALIELKVRYPWSPDRLTLVVDTQIANDKSTRTPSGGPKLRTNRRARSSRPDQRGRGGGGGGPVYEGGHHGGGGGYPRVLNRSTSEHNVASRPASR